MEILDYGVVIDSSVKRLISGRSDASASAKADLENLERTLSRVKPPRELKKFHSEISKAVRYVILGHGFAARESHGAATKLYGESGLRLCYASDALRELCSRNPNVIDNMRLSPVTRMCLAL